MNPLERGRRKITEAIALTGMRPPLTVPNRTRIPLRGKRVLITGASSGIGEAGAEAFAAEGAEVIVVARRADLLDEVVTRIAERGVPRPHCPAICPTSTRSMPWPTPSCSASAGWTSW